VLAAACVGLRSNRTGSRGSDVIDETASETDEPGVKRMKLRLAERLDLRSGALLPVAPV
jgi:hypothetical protein